MVNWSVLCLFLSLKLYILIDPKSINKDFLPHTMEFFKDRLMAIMLDISIAQPECSLMIFALFVALTH